MAKTESLKFFKIVVNPQDDKLRIPTAFIRKHGLNLPDEVTLKAPNGSIRQIKLIKVDGHTCLHGGWEEFRDFYSIRFGHVLVFKYDGQSHFDVSILDMTTVEIEYPLDASISAGYQLSDTEVNGLESDNSAEIVKDVCTSSEAKGKRSYDEFNRESNGQLSKKRNATITDKESCVAYQRAKAFKSNNPFCICLMQPSYVDYQFVLNIPVHFPMENLPGQEKKHKLRLRVQKRRTWAVTCSLVSGRARINGGWYKFVNQNSLKVGDACVFEVDKHEKLLWNVTIFRG